MCRVGDIEGRHVERRWPSLIPTIRAYSIVVEGGDGCTYSASTAFDSRRTRSPLPQGLRRYQAQALADSLAPGMQLDCHSYRGSDWLLCLLDRPDRALITTKGLTVCEIVNMAPGPAPRCCSEDCQQELLDVLTGPAPGGDRWYGRTVASWIGEYLGRRIRRQTGWRRLRWLGARWRKPNTAMSPSTQPSRKTSKSASVH